MAFAVSATIGVRPPVPFEAADPARRLEAVHLGHLAVHEDHVVGQLRPQLERFDAVRGDVHAAAELAQHAHGDLLVDRVVLGDERASARRLPARRPAAP